MNSSAFFKKALNGFDVESLGGGGSVGVVNEVPEATVAGAGP